MNATLLREDEWRISGVKCRAVASDASVTTFFPEPNREKFRIIFDSNPNFRANSHTE